MGRLFGLFFSGMFKSEFWVERWQTLLAVVRDAPKFFKDAGKPKWNDDAYLLGMTATFTAIIPAGMLFWGLLGLLTGWAGMILFPIVILIAFVLWALGVVAVYYIVSRLYALAIKWVTGQKPDMDKVRPIVFLCTIGTPLAMIPGAGSLLTVALTIVLLVVAYENALSAPRGQAIGMGLLGMVLNGVFFMVVSLAFGALITFATLGAGSAFAALGGLKSLYSTHASPSMSPPETAKEIVIPKGVDLAGLYAGMTEDQKIDAASDRLVAALNKLKPREDWGLKHDRGVYESMFMVFLTYTPEVMTNSGWNIPLAARRLAYEKTKAQEWEAWKKIIPSGGLDDFYGGLQDALMGTVYPMTKEAQVVFGPDTVTSNVASAQTGSSGGVGSSNEPSRTEAASEKPGAEVAPKPVVHHASRPKAVEAAPPQEQASEPSMPPTLAPQENTSNKVVEKAAGNAIKKGLGRAFGF